MDNKAIFSFINKDFQTHESFIVFEYIVSLLNNKEEILYQENYENRDYLFNVFIRVCDYYIGHTLFGYSHTIDSDKENQLQRYLSEYLRIDNLVKKNVIDFLFFKLFVVDIYIPKIAVHYYYQQEKYLFIPDNFFFLNENVDNLLNNCTEFLNLTPFLDVNLSKKQIYYKLSIIFNILIDKKIYSNEIWRALIHHFSFNSNNLIYWKTSYNYIVTFYISSYLVPYYIYKKITSEALLSEMFNIFYFDKKSLIYQINNKIDKDEFLLSIKESYPDLYLIFKTIYEEQYISSNIEHF